MHFAPLGDSAVMITLGDTIDERTHRLVRAASRRIRAEPPPGFIDIVPAFVSIVVHYEPLTAREQTKTGTPYDRVVGFLRERLADLDVEDLDEPRTVEIPVCYGGELGPDLDDVARLHGLTPEDVIRLHTGAEYLVYMIGFMPGFAYLGGLPERIATPRRKTPRTAVPAGTVGIGGRQTGVYPLVSPGGWNLIGRTPVKIFDFAREEPTLVSTGDRVRFRAIARAEFDEVLA
ncbi:MAG TPA: 5-oxoprolinase subunit PxpB [Gemmatimonadaceae bacterium]